MRYAFLLQIKEGTEAEYDRRHQAVFPDLLAQFRQAGIRTYSIYRDGTTLFAYMEADDIEGALKAVEASEADQRWQAYMADILVPFPTGSRTKPLPEVFHFES
ncbi:MAG: L-rhamnose mutarotase [Firmicutes bacterium]|nr:L-rhamnose mutarotase [Bacillota bacterium]